MKKLTLRLDELRVESFATAEERAAPGTVRAHAESVDATECPVAECYSYGGTCGASPPIWWYRGERNTARHAKTGDYPTHLECCV